jgi:HK97 family phage prohead protease
VEFRAADPDADDGRLGTLEGYAAVFNEPTVIDSWEGRFEERIAPGAFRKTLRERGDRVKVLFNHGFDPQIGDKPLGKPSSQVEDARGLYVEVPLDDTSYNRDLVASLRSGALDGMSFRFSVNRDEWVSSDDDMPVRTLRDVTLYEYGPVTFPAYEATTAGVRARDAYQAWRTAHPSTEFLSDAADTGTSDDTDDTPPLGHLLSDTEKARLKAGLRQLFKPWEGQNE